MLRSKLLLVLWMISAAAVAHPPLDNQPKPAAPAPPARQQPAPVSAQQPAPQAPQQPAPAPAQTPQQPAAPAAPAGKPTGLDIQVQLDRAGFSPGIIDGKPGSNTKKALSAFQEAHDLPVTGNLDAATWESLAAAGSGPTIGEYAISQEDADGPFTPQIPEDMLEKTKLPGLYYTSVLEALSERFHATPEFLKRLNPQARFAAGERIKVPNVRGAIAAESGDVRVVVSKANGTLTVDRGGDVLFFAPVTSGSEHDPLPIGDWKVNGVAKNPTFNYNPDLFWDADPTHTKAKVPAGPNNPVGVVWIDISKEHYGLHGTPEPRTIGRSESHGCVRLTNWDALTLASLVKPGTPVLFRP
jgi:lipoprotein-anchoring transpeptidase ErfK/SrfK